MIWIARSGKSTNNAALEKRLWSAAEQAVPASHLAKSEYNVARPEGLLGLSFLRFTEVRFTAQRTKLEKAAANGGKGNLPRRGSRVDEPVAHHAEGVPCLTAEARFNYLLNRPQFGSTIPGHGVNTPFTFSTRLQDSGVVPQPNYFVLEAVNAGFAFVEFVPDSGRLVCTFAAVVNPSTATAISLAPADPGLLANA